MATLDLAVRTLFQEFQEAVLQRVSLEEGLQREGTFVRKRIKGCEYWYRQRYSQGQTVQDYVGPITQKLRDEISRSRRDQAERRRLIRQTILVERRRSAMLRKGGLPGLDSLTASVVERLAKSGLADRGGVLVGSHAFAAYSGPLGKIFEVGSLKTQDIDVVCEQGGTDPEEIVEIIAPEGFLKVRANRFYPIPGLSKKSLPASFAGPGGLRIDVLTPLRGKPAGVVPLKRFPRIGAQSLHFLDFLIQDPIRSVLLGPQGGVAVTVPDPSRFAIHKLIVAARRPITESAKREKDLLQAAQLIAACLVEYPDELKKVSREAARRGEKWRKALHRSISKLPSDTVSALESFLNK